MITPAKIFRELEAIRLGIELLLGAQTGKSVSLHNELDGLGFDSPPKEPLGPDAISYEPTPEERAQLEAEEFENEKTDHAYVDAVGGWTKWRPAKERQGGRDSG